MGKELTTEQLRIRFKLPGNEFITIEILDISGRLVYSSSWNALAEETHEILWNDINQGRAGLTNEELHLCHYQVYIPTNPDYSSLNLASVAPAVPKKGKP